VKEDEIEKLLKEQAQKAEIPNVLPKILSADFAAHQDGAYGGVFDDAFESAPQGAGSPQVKNADNAFDKRRFSLFMAVTAGAMALMFVVFFVILPLIGLMPGLPVGKAPVVEFMRVANGSRLEVLTGASIQLDVKIKYAGKKEAERVATKADVSFSSSRTSVATVDEDGLITVVGAGGANIIIESVKTDVNRQKVWETLALEVLDAPQVQISVAGVPSTASINTRVTLPKATAVTFPASGKSLTVFVSVKYSISDGLNPPLWVYEDVKCAIVDEDTGFAVSLTDEKVVFDNGENMSFYPTQKGRYDVEYYAADEDGNESTRMNYIITCEDRSAPQLVEIADGQIPKTWGIHVFETVDGVKTPVSGNIVFPYPHYIDNSGPGGVARVGFTIRDTVHDNVVLNIYDIYNTSGGNDNIYQYNPNILSNGYYIDDGYAGPAGYPPPLVFTQEGLEFNFNNYVKNEILCEAIDGFDGLGKYTVQYQARDNDHNISTKTYEITLLAEYTK